MTSDRNEMRERLEEEVADLRFTGHEAVMRRIQSPSRLDKLRAFWNREIEVPVVPASLLLAVLAGACFQLRPPEASETKTDTAQQAELIEVEGNIYWKEDYERMVARVENQD